MTQAFGNPILGGASKLIRAAIMSINYVAGTSGWTINRDGTAEFQSAIIRGAINATSGTFTGTVNANAGTFSGTVTIAGALAVTGSIIAGVAPNPQVTVKTSGLAGIIEFDMNDTIGNLLPGTISMTRTLNGSPNVTGTVLIRSPYHTAPSTQDGGYGKIEFTSGAADGTGNGAEVRATVISQDGASGYIGLDLFQDGCAFGSNSLAGKYSYEEVFLPAQVVASSAGSSIVTGLLVNQQWMNYNAWNYATGVWTCPARGFWSFTFSLAFAAWVAGSRLRMIATRNGTAAANIMGQIDVPTDGGAGMLTFRKYLLAGDTVSFRVAQVTGVAQTIAVGSLADERSYISIQREL